MDTPTPAPKLDIVKTDGSPWRGVLVYVNSEGERKPALMKFVARRSEHMPNRYKGRFVTRIGDEYHATPDEFKLEMQ